MHSENRFIPLALHTARDAVVNLPPAGALRASSYCIFVNLPARRDRVLLVHGYTGAYDEVSLDVAAFLNSRRTTVAPLFGKWSFELDRLRDFETPSDDTLAELENRGYLTTLTLEEEKEQLRSIAGLVHQFDTSHNYVLVPSYDCNLRCPYCFQDHMRTDPSCGSLLRPMTREIADRTFDAILDLEAAQPEGREEYRQFTLFGGEPLAAANLDIVSYIVGRAASLGPCSIGAVTNGTDLDAYADLLGPGRISSLQITLDGPAATHDRFRVYQNGEGSFERIARNITLALNRRAVVSVRVNVCKDNVGGVPDLAREAARRGWIEDEQFQMYAAPIQPTDRFADKRRLLTSHELDEALRALRESDPASVAVESSADAMRARALRLFQDPDLDPIADFKASYCGAHSGMYIFDPFGDIYACWERMGDPRIRIGRVSAEGKCEFDAPMLSKWHTRTVASNPTCESCAYSLHCGGGCAVLAEAQNGEYFSNFCDGFGVRFRTAVAAAYEEHLTRESSPAPRQATAAEAVMKAGCL